MAMLLPSLSITLNQRRWICVIDPTLFLSSYGLLLVQLLGEVLDLWIARELWHMLENPSSYLSQNPRIDSLSDWAIVQANTLPADRHLFWIGDRPADSFFPDGMDPQLIGRWEVLARSLDQRLQQKSPASNLMAPAFRDTAALAAVLGSAFILTYQPLGDRNGIHEPPQICQVLEQWGIPCQPVDAGDEIAAIEREKLLQLMVSTGCSKYLWTGLNLTIFHLFVPSAWATLNCWEDARGYWYSLHTAIQN